MQGEVVVYLLLLHSNLINIPAALDVSTTGWHKYMYIALFCFSQIFNLYFWRKKSSGPQLLHTVCHTCSNTLGSNFKTSKLLKIIQVLYALMLINCENIYKNHVLHHYSLHHNFKCTIKTHSGAISPDLLEKIWSCTNKACQPSMQPILFIP